MLKGNILGLGSKCMLKSTHPLEQRIGDAMLRAGYRSRWVIHYHNMGLRFMLREHTLVYSPKQQVCTLQ